MPSAVPTAETTTPAMGPAAAESLAALYVTHAERVEALALAKLRMVTPAIDADAAADVAADVWLTLAERAASGSLPSPGGAWDTLRQIVVSVVTDAHPIDRREVPAALAPLHPAAPSLARVERLADVAARPALIGAAL
jgi:hypothetical protein